MQVLSLEFGEVVGVGIPEEGISAQHHLMLGLQLPLSAGNSSINAASQNAAQIRKFFVSITFEFMCTSRE